MMRRLRQRLATGLEQCLRMTALAAIGLSPAGAAEFAVAVSPPRFELEVKPGETVREVIEITNAAAQSSVFKVRTADWSLAPDASVSFMDELAPSSCRPWVAIERRELTVTPGRPYRFRFEVAPPADAQPVECRFAIMIEGQDQTTTSAGLAIPFNARLGVIVYAAVGDVQPQLSVVGSGVQNVNGEPTPVLQVRNTGTAHGRLGGFLSGTDASNTKLDFAPGTTPILPGETRTVALVATRSGDPHTAVAVRFPVTIRGKLEWGKKQSQDLEQRFQP